MDVTAMNKYSHAWLFVSFCNIFCCCRVLMMSMLHESIKQCFMFPREACSNEFISKALVHYKCIALNNDTFLNYFWVIVRASIRSLYCAYVQRTRTSILPL